MFFFELAFEFAFEIKIYYVIRKPYYAVIQKRIRAIRENPCQKTTPQPPFQNHSHHQTVPTNQPPNPLHFAIPPNRQNLKLPLKNGSFRP
jgi:hypothetical protein